MSTKKSRPIVKKMGSNSFVISFDIESSEAVRMPGQMQEIFVLSTRSLFFLIRLFWRECSDSPLYITSSNSIWFCSHFATTFCAYCFTRLDFHDPSINCQFLQLEGTRMSSQLLELSCHSERWLAVTLLRIPHTQHHQICRRKAKCSF